MLHLASHKVLDRLNHVIMADAATEVARKRLLELSAARMGVLIEKRNAGHDDARSAEAALIGGMVDESLLNGMEHTTLTRETFDGRDVLAFAVEREHLARRNRIAIYDDVAAAASSILAGNLGAK